LNVRALKITNDHSHYSNTQLPPQLQKTLNDRNEHNHYSNTQLPPQLQITLNDTKERSLFSNTQLPPQSLQQYPASTTVSNNTK